MRFVVFGYNGGLDWISGPEGMIISQALQPKLFCLFYFSESLKSLSNRKY